MPLNGHPSKALALIFTKHTGGFMDNEIEVSIRFAIQREILLMLLKKEMITKDEYEKSLAELRAKQHCKLIVTSADL